MIPVLEKVNKRARRSRAAPVKTAPRFLEPARQLQRSIGNSDLQRGAGFIQRLPFGITLPTGLRFLDATEETMARGVYGSSIDFGKVLLSDAGGGASAYCYVPGKWFGLYGAEQIAQQVERGEAPIIAEVSSAAPGSTHLGNVASLAAPHWEVRGGPGVRC